MAKPPKTPPQDKVQKKAPKSDELKKEEAAPGKTLNDVTNDEKGTPPDSKTSWN
ncbi:hypothetical protein ACSMXM_14665 [Pacificimonas sp. ICDLI1SI03]